MKFKSLNSIFIGVITLLFMVQLTNGTFSGANSVKKTFDKISIQKFEDIFKKYKKQNSNSHKFENVVKNFDGLAHEAFKNLDEKFDLKGHEIFHRRQL